MSSERPFWKGKTLEELSRLRPRVKVTMENGIVIIGPVQLRTQETSSVCHLSIQVGNGGCLHVFSAVSRNALPCLTENVQSVELLDDPEYERIDNIEDVHVGGYFRRQ